MKKYFHIGKTVLLLAVLVVSVSCKDAWNEHYSFKETESKYPVAKLAETLGDISGYDQFCLALSNTRMCDKNGVPLSMSYMDLLSEDQFLTVWAPSNSSIDDWTLYTKRDKTPAEHKEVGEKFIMNHIARFKHSVGSDTVRIVMMNGKTYNSRPDDISGQPYHADDYNIRCSNGVLHCIDGHMDYLPSLYEYITTDAECKEIFGDWFKSFTIQELDPSRSVAQGINENGEMVYIDSVLTEYNRLMSTFGYINAEDSLYAIVMPTKELWTEVYDRIKEYFLYNELYLNNDSLQKFYTNYTMMTDMFFNMNPDLQIHLPDSAFSTLYDSYENRRDKKSYHIFYNPFANDGIFGGAVKTVECSNGTVYFIDKWPFSDSLTYLRTIKLEAENYSGLSRFQLRRQTIQRINGVALENPIQVMRISMEGMSKWDAKMYIEDNLRGRYAVKMVVAPNEVSEKPCYIHPRIAYDTPTEFDSTLVDSMTIEEYYDKRGKLRTRQAKYYAINDMTKLDTIDLGVIDIPYCNYDMNQSRLSVTLSSGVDLVDKYTSELWLDCIILEPVVE